MEDVTNVCDKRLGKKFASFYRCLAFAKNYRVLELKNKARAFLSLSKLELLDRVLGTALVGTKDNGISLVGTPGTEYRLSQPPTLGLRLRGVSTLYDHVQRHRRTT